MKFCPKCGKQLDDNALFCAYCGAQFAQSQQNSGVDAQGYYIPSGGGVTQPPLQPYIPPVRKKNKTLPIILIALAVVLVMIIVVVVIGVVSGGDDDTGSSNNSSYSVDNGDEGNTEEFASELFFGEVVGNIYTNQSMGVNVPLPSSDWYFLSDSEIASDYCSGEAEIDATSGKAYIEDGEKSYFDAVLYDTTTNDNVSVQIMKPSDTSWSSAKVLGEVFDGACTNYEDMNATVLEKDRDLGYVQIGSYSYDFAHLSVNYLGVEISQYIAVAQVDSGYVIITFSGYFDGDIYGFINSYFN